MDEAARSSAVPGWYTDAERHEIYRLFGWLWPRCVEARGLLVAAERPETGGEGVKRGALAAGIREGAGDGQGREAAPDATHRLAGSEIEQRLREQGASPRRRSVPPSLPRLSERDAQRIGITIGMPAELQPTIQFAVVGKEKTIQVARENPAGSCDMSRQTGSLKAVCSSPDQLTYLRHHFPFFGVALGVKRKGLDDFFTTHT